MRRCSIGVGEVDDSAPVRADLVCDVTAAGTSVPPEGIEKLHRRAG